MSGKPGVIVHQGALGDFLLALPIIEGLSRASSGFRFDLWSRRDHLSLLYGKNYVAAGFDSAGAEWTPLFQEDQWRECALPPGVAEAGWIFIFGQPSSRDLVERLKRRVRAPVYWLRSFPGPGDKRHTTDFLEEQVRDFSLPLQMASCRLIPDPGEVAAMRARIVPRGKGVAHPLVVIHPGSGGFRKIWPLSRWRSLLHWLSERRDVRIVMVLGPADERIRPFAGEAQTAYGVTILDDLRLPALGALLSDAGIYIGNDSGVTHLAASMGTPTIALFGPSDPAVWGPRGAEIEILRDSWAEEEVLDSQPGPSLSDLELQIRAVIAARLA